MRYYRILLVFALIVGRAATATASEEEFLPWQQVKIVCSQRPEAGIVVFEAGVDTGTYKTVSIKVFGKQYDLNAPQLAMLHGFQLSSLSITHEAGYAELGGHTVYFKMKSVRYHAQSKRLLEEKVTIGISRGKGLTISKQETKEVK